MHPSEQDISARLAMITFAERAFAERGIDSVSMRQVALGAEQRNNSAVAYHFGGREGLIAAILEHRTAPIDARRLELIAEMEASGQTVALAGACRVFVQPLAETVTGKPSWYLRFLAAATVDPARRELGGGEEPSGVTWVNRHIAALLPGLPRATLRRRMRWMVLITLRVLADHERISTVGTTPATVTGQIVDDLVHTLAALLAAPTPG